MSNYVILDITSGTKFCTLQQIDNISEKNAEIKRGAKAKNWPADVRFHMDPNFPKQIQLPDWVKCLHDYLVVSKPLKEAIAEEAPADVEYLPISIIDHKGKVASSDYFVLNPFTLQDCIDQQASKIKWNPIDKSKIMSCPKLVIDESRIAPGAKIFRLKHFTGLVVLARDLAESLDAAGFKGADFEEIDEFTY